MKREPFTISWPAAVIGLLSTCAIDYFWLPHHQAVPGRPVEAWTEVAQLVLAVALSYVAGKLLAGKQKSPFDDKPTTLSERGAFLPRLIGRRRVGPVFGWAGERASRTKKGSKSSNTVLRILQGPGPATKSYYEDGWHQLCVGPAFALHKIYQAGEVIFEGPITSTSHPSGSTIDLGDEGVFRIFWGEFDQPINNFLGFSFRVGIASRWPGVCYIEWQQKKLGTSALWPVLEYEVEVRTQSTILTQTPAVMEPTLSAEGEDVAIYSMIPGAPGSGYFILNGIWTYLFKPLNSIHLVGNSGLADQTLVIRDVVAAYPGGSAVYPHTSIETRIYVEDVTIPADGGAGTSGTLSIFQANGGINPAHIIAELLFETNGYGLDFNQTRWDLDSLEEVGLLAVEENLFSSILAQNGQTYREIIAGMMLDLGMMISTDPETGRNTFVPIREPSGALQNIQAALQTEIPEIDVQHGARPSDQLVFSFPDENNAYHDMTIGQDDDGQIRYYSFPRAQKIQLISTTSFVAANSIAERRVLENLAGGAKFGLKCNRSCRYLLPGTPVTADGFDDILRVIDVEFDALSGEVLVTVVPDYYGAALSDFQQNQGNTGTVPDPAQPDDQFTIVEVPEYLLGFLGGQVVAIPRVRGNTSVTGAELYLSRDDVTYTPEGQDTSQMAGGLTLDALSADGLFDDQSGPQVTIEIDADSVLDLSADSISWRNGRQLLILENPSGEQEICFLQGITPVSGTTYTLDGILRARFDTIRIDVPIGSRFWILQDDDAAFLQDVFLEPEVILYAKTQPFGQGIVELDTITAESRTLYGKGVRPIPIGNLRMDTNAVCYLSGADVEVHWAYCTPQSVGSGAGFQAAGNAMADVPPEGDFLVEFLDVSDVVVRTTQVTDNSFTYTAAQRVVDYGSDPASLKIRVTQLRSGFSSDPVTQTFTKVS